MAKDLKTLALARLSGFRHKTVKVPEWGNVSVVLREPSAEAWYLWREVLDGGDAGDETLSVVAKTRRNLEADVTLFCDVLCDTDLQRVFTPDDREQVLAVYGQGERARERMRELQQIRDSFRQKDADLQSQYQTGDISEDFYRQARAQNAQYLSERLKDQAAFYAESDVQRADWQKGLQEGLSNWVDNASDYASQAAQLATEGISGLVNNITEMLNGNKVEWRNWASSVLQEISKVLMNAAIVNGIKTAANSMSGAGGFIGSIGDWLGGAVANAKGGVYTSANLSAYSNSIVDTPTYFAFAKGAGLMGEAGPEAIMPLTRAADGSLGVRAVGSMNGSAGLVYSPVYHIAIQNDGANGQIGPEAAGTLVQLIDQRVQAVMLSMRRDGGMLSG
ncbi:phage tail tape measure protein [Escherichia coli]|uniref:phage tail tape measure protein n=1 Tax=Escherichia coli TaxID=562 RepID=UPI003EC94C72